jgi:hypothetical protein
MLPDKFRFIWLNGFRGEEFLKSANQKEESPVVVMFVNGSGRNEQSSQRTFDSLGKSYLSFNRRIFFRNEPIRK